jgi:septum formation protein
VADPGPDRAWPGRAEPRHGVRALALEKARRIAARRPGAVVIGADTVVVLRGERLGKPANAAEARAMIERLHGRRHEVWTGLAIVRDGEQRTGAECTVVHFARLTAEDIAAYVRSGESLDKAGAYGIQGLAGQFVKRIEGDYTTVVGLPLARLKALLADFA